MITNNLQNSFSADDIDETGHLFKPLKDSDSNKPSTGGDKPFTFMITSTPREVEDVPEEQEDEEGMATYVWRVKKKCQPVVDEGRWRWRIEKNKREKDEEGMNTNIWRMKEGWLEKE